MGGRDAAVEQTAGSQQEGTGADAGGPSRAQGDIVNARCQLGRPFAFQRYRGADHDEGIERGGLQRLGEYRKPAGTAHRPAFQRRDGELVIGR
ncbi:hypothetical protein D3C81_1765870 [compost metagenome]